MKDAEIVQYFRVLILEESSTRGNLFKTWLTGVSTAVAATPEDLLREFDSSVAVICLSQALLEDEEDEIRRYVLNQNPYCQFVLLATGSPSSVLDEQRFDATINRPVSKRELQMTVEKRLKYGIYGALLEEFYSLNAKLVSLKRAGPSEASVDQDGVEEQLRQVKQPLERLRSSIDHGDMTELLRSLNLHRRYLTEPVRDVETSTTSKYHPNSCPDCKLPWGVDHRNALGVGFTQIGAYVWKCTRCRSISHGAGPSDRHIARR